MDLYLHSPTCLRGLHKAFTFTYLTDEEFLLTKLETLRDFGEICEQYTLTQGLYLYLSNRRRIPPYETRNLTRF